LTPVRPDEFRQARRRGHVHRQEDGREPDLHPELGKRFVRRFPSSAEKPRRNSRERRGGRITRIPGGPRLFPREKILENFRRRFPMGRADGGKRRKPAGLDAHRLPGPYSGGENRLYCTRRSFQCRTFAEGPAPTRTLATSGICEADWTAAAVPPPPLTAMKTSGVLLSVLLWAPPIGFREMTGVEPTPLPSPTFRRPACEKTPLPGSYLDPRWRPASWRPRTGRHPPPLAKVIPEGGV